MTKSAVYLTLIGLSALGIAVLVAWCCAALSRVDWLGGNTCSRWYHSSDVTYNRVLVENHNVGSSQLQLLPRKVRESSTEDMAVADGIKFDNIAVPYWVSVEWLAADKSGANRFVVAHGWPFTAMKARFEKSMSGKKKWDVVGGFEIPTAHVSSSRFVSGTPGVPLIMPLTPVWLGLVGNAIIYLCSVIAIRWLLLFAVRKVRIKRGLCGHCKYDLRYTPTGRCPECGVSN